MKLSEDYLVEVYDTKEASLYVENGYRLEKVYTREEYCYNHELRYTTLHDAYTAYILIKEK